MYECQPFQILPLLKELTFINVLEMSHQFAM